MTPLPEPQKPGEVRQADLIRLEQLLQDLSKQYLQQCGERSPRDEKYTAAAKLYAGAKRLRQAVVEGAVADAIIEISSNLVGCEQLALIVACNKPDRIAFIGSVGLNQEQLRSIRMNAKSILQEASTDSIYISTFGEQPDPLLSSLGITAFVPFWLDYSTQGAIVFFDLLPQRNGLDSTDRELLMLLSAYAGPCLSAGKEINQETCE